jgi:mannose-6-phosphate isomerase-like protein (cupin superfamily)
MEPDVVFETRRATETADAIAPDGSEVRLLCGLARGGMALFKLPAGEIAAAVGHRTVEELWYVIAGHGRIWRQADDREEIVALDPGVSLSIPTGTHFQFRCDGPEPLTILGATMPPWPGANEAYPVPGIWHPTR